MMRATYPRSPELAPSCGHGNFQVENIEVLMGNGSLKGVSAVWSRCPKLIIVYVIAPKSSPVFQERNQIIRCLTLLLFSKKKDDHNAQSRG